MGIGMLVLPDQDQLNLGLLVTGVFIVLLAVLWNMRRSRLSKKNRGSAHRTTPEVASAAPVSEFTKFYDKALDASDTFDTSAKTKPSDFDQADLNQDPNYTLSEAAPDTDTAATTGLVVLKDFRKALDDGMDLPTAARKHGLTEDEARVAEFCYNPPDA